MHFQLTFLHSLGIFTGKWIWSPGISFDKKCNYIKTVHRAQLRSRAGRHRARPTIALAIQARSVVRTGKWIWSPGISFEENCNCIETVNRHQRYTQDEASDHTQDDTQDDTQDEAQDDTQDEAQDEEHDDTQDEGQDEAQVDTHDDTQDDTQDEAHDDTQDEA